MKILIIDYRPGKETAEIVATATDAGHDIYVASAEEPNLPHLKRDIKIGNKADRIIHKIIGYISDSYHLHSTRPTSSLLSRIAEINPDVIHIYNIEEHYINIPLTAYVLMKYKIPTLLTLENPGKIYRDTKALIKRRRHNKELFTSTFSTWELLHIASSSKEVTEDELAADHPGYIVAEGKEAETYMRIYEAIR